MFEGWVITEDHLSVGEHSRRGWGQRTKEEVEERSGIAQLINPRVIQVETDLHASELKDPVKFRLYDGDGELCYAGVISVSWLNGDEGLAFAPLRYGEADAGCTEMCYVEDGDVHWRPL